MALLPFTCFVTFQTFSPSLSVNALPQLSITLSVHQSAFSLGFLSVKRLQYNLQTLSLPVCHLQARKTIGSNLVSLSCCHSERVTSANQQRYLWRAEENLGDPISCTHTCTQVYTPHALPRQTSPHTCLQSQVHVCRVFLAQAGAAVHRCAHTDLHVCNLLYASKCMCKGVTHTDSQRAETVTFSSKGWDRTRIFFITWRCMA